MALLSHYRVAMAKTSSADLGGFDPVFKHLNLFVQALLKNIDDPRGTFGDTSCQAQIDSHGQVVNRSP